MYFSVLGSVIPSIGDPPCSGAHCSARFAFQIPFASLRACLRFLREEKRAATSKAEVALLSLATTGTTRAHAQIDDKFFTPVRLIPGITPLKLSFKTGVSRGQVERRQRASYGDCSEAASSREDRAASENRGGQSQNPGHRRRQPAPPVHAGGSVP